MRLTVHDSCGFELMTDCTLSERRDLVRNLCDSLMPCDEKSVSLLTLQETSEKHCIAPILPCSPLNS